MRPSGERATNLTYVAVAGDLVQLGAVAVAPRALLTSLQPKNSTLLHAASRRRCTAVRGKGNRIDAARMPGEGAQLPAARCIPKLHRRRHCSRSQACGHPRKRPPNGHLYRMPGEGAKLPAARCIPKLERLVSACARKHAAVRGKGNRIDNVRMSGEGREAPGRSLHPKA